MKLDTSKLLIIASMTLIISSCNRPANEEDEVKFDTIVNGVPENEIAGKNREKILEEFNTRKDKTEVKLEELRKKSVAEKYGESDEMLIKLKELEQKQLHLEKMLNELQASPDQMEELRKEIDSAIVSLERAIEKAETEMNSGNIK